MSIATVDPILTAEEGAFFNFRPRPNRPERYDEQQAFVDSMDQGVSFCVGGNGSGTSIAAACKIARFVLYRQPPPQFDTPFWIIGPDFVQTIETFWKEKLYGRGFIPDCEIDWERVTWYDKRRLLPATVPLLPWVNGDPRKNWVLEFRSSEQGRIAMQAREIGGFCFTEQFPWDVLTEVLRGMRRTNLPGGKFCEFTPIDPVLSAPLKEMMENDSLPPGWKVYRCNTRCNVEDPNSEVTEAWYDEFFGMVGDEMRDTREIGAWATFAGLMYKEFNSRVHCFEADAWPIPENAIHKRCIDWGSGPHNAFCVLWLATYNGIVWVYDEYWTCEPNTHEERMREVHALDGWKLVCVSTHPNATYTLEPLRDDCQPRWRYDSPYYQQTYGPPDDPGMFRECLKYCMPVTRMTLGPYSYQPSVELMQGMLGSVTRGVKPRLFISKRCKNLIRELQGMRWKEPPSKSINPMNAKPFEVEKDNHSPSALRGGLWTHMQGSGNLSAFKVEPPVRPQIRFKR